MSWIAQGILGLYPVNLDQVKTLTFGKSGQKYLISFNLGQNLAVNHLYSDINEFKSSLIELSEKIDTNLVYQEES